MMWKEEDVQFHEVGLCFDDVELMYQTFIPQSLHRSIRLIYAVSMHIILSKTKQ